MQLQAREATFQSRRRQLAQVLRHSGSQQGIKRPRSRGGIPSLPLRNKHGDKKSHSSSTVCLAWSKENMPRCTIWRPRCTPRKT